jgi:ribokinase
VTRSGMTGSGVTGDRSNRVLVVGDIVTDILAVYSGLLAVGSDTAADISIAGGGSGANTAAWLASLNCPVSLVGVAGTDRAGDQRLAELAAAGVDCTAIRRSPDAPTGSVIVLADTAERSMLCDRGANLLLSPSDVDSALAGPAAHLHLSGYMLLDSTSRPAGRHALAAAKAYGLTTSVDAASAAPLRRVGAAFLDWVRGTDILFANLEEAMALLPASDKPADLARSLATYARHAVVKLGPYGAMWAGEDGTVVRIPATPATAVVDPTGAGDAFAAGLLAAWLTGADPTSALHGGARCGAQAVALIGGRPPSQGFGLRAVGRPSGPNPRLP